MTKVKILCALIIGITYPELGVAQESFTYQAFNKATRLHYTVTNDNENLYVVMKAEDPIDASKVLMGGITLSFNPSGQKKEAPYSITFPVVAKPQSGQGRSMKGGIDHHVEGPAFSQKTDAPGTAEARNKKLAAFTEIQVVGLDIPDTLISIYNTYGIKAAMNYDEEGSLVSKFQIPLKLLKLKVENPKAFSYNIKVNGRPMPAPPLDSQNAEWTGRPGAGRGSLVIRKANGRSGVINLDPSVLEPTDFWGTYLLISK